MITQGNAIAGYIGIKNWPEKSQLLLSSNYSVCECDTAALVYDCDRHIDFLTAYEKQGPQFDPRNTLYYAFYMFISGDLKAKAKCENFISLYEVARNTTFFDSTPCAAITDDGMRLDGSHRASIAFILGIRTLFVKSYRWSDLFPRRAMRHIQKEFDIKILARKTHSPANVFSRQTNNYLGKLIYTDCMVEYRKFLRWNLPKVFVRYRSIVAIKSYSSAMYIPKNKVLVSYY